MKHRIALLLYPVFRILVRYCPGIDRKKSILNIVEKNLAWRSCDVLFSSRDGLKFRADLSDEIPRHIYFFGRWEECLSLFVRERLEPGDVFIDVGANIGYFSMLAAKLVGPAGRVVAIEASKPVFDSLVINARLNGFDNIRPLNIAVSDRSRDLEIFAPEGSTGRTTTSSARAEECHASPVGVVHAHSLSSIVSTAEISRARLIKIDVEGAEWDVVTGLLPVLSNARQDLEIVIEISPRALASENHTPSEFIHRFESLGFFSYILENRYDLDYFLNGPEQWRPVRLREALTEQADLIFSRRETDIL